LTESASVKHTEGSKTGGNPLILYLPMFPEEATTMRTTKFISGIVLALLLSGMFLAAVPVQATVTHTITTATPITYGDYYHINMWLNVTPGSGWWNGTLYVNVTDPDGGVTEIDHVHLTITNAAGYNSNITYDRIANIPGEWSAAWHFVQISKSTVPNFPSLVTDHNSDWTVGDRPMQILGADLNEMTVLMFSVFGILVLLVVFGLFINAFEKKGKR